jgi:hypothetical protein
LEFRLNQTFVSGLIRIATVAAGLATGLSLSHVLEIPGKHSLTPLEFVHVQHSFYGGYAIFGAIAWIFSSVAGLVAGFVFYKIDKALATYLFIACAGFLICLGIFAFFLNYYNHLIAGWSTVFPADWQKVRNHWEISHAVVFIFSTTSFLAFLHAYGIIKLNRL